MPLVASALYEMTKKHQRSGSEVEIGNGYCKEVLKKTQSSKSLPTLREGLQLPAKSTLADLLAKKSRIEAFRAFLEKEFSDENLEFWMKVEGYRKQKQAKQAKLAPVIFQTYIEVGSSREINIDAATRKITRSLLESPDSITFDLAASAIFALMERDPFPRFMALHPTLIPLKEQRYTSRLKQCYWSQKRAASEASSAAVIATSVGLMFHGRTIESQQVAVRLDL